MTNNNVIENWKDKEKNSKIFVELVENINILLFYLTRLYIKGYPNILCVKIHIENSIVIEENNKDKKINNIIEYYKELTKILENSQTKAYRYKPLIILYLL